MSTQVGQARLRAAATLPVLLALVLGGGDAAAQLPERAGFVVLRGADTLAVESFERSPTAITGILVVPASGQRLGYRMELTPTAAVTRAEIRVWSATAPDTAPPLQQGTMTFSGDSVTLEGTGTRKVAASPGSIPYLNLSGAGLELLVRRARASASTSVPILLPTGQPLTVTVAPLVGDSAVMRIGNVELRLALGPDGQLLSADVPSQGVRMVRVGAVALGPLAKPDYSAPAGAPYTAESVTLPGPTGTLAGTLTLPQTRPGRMPAVVTITGSGLEDRDEAIPFVRGYRPFRQVADTLSRLGIAVLRLDDRGCGESAGDIATATSVDFARDIEAAISYLRTRPEIDPARIGLVGHSEGGIIAPLVAVEDPRIRAIVIMAGPAWNGRRVLTYQMRYLVEHGDTTLRGTSLDSAAARQLATWDSAATKTPWIRYFMDYDPLPTARKVKQPVLILQGATDQQVAAAQATELAAAIRAGGNRDVTLRVFPDRDHLFLLDKTGNPNGYATLPARTIDGEVMGTLADWLVQRLRASRVSPGRK